MASTKRNAQGSNNKKVGIFPEKDSHGETKRPLIEPLAFNNKQ